MFSSIESVNINLNESRCNYRIFNTYCGIADHNKVPYQANVHSIDSSPGLSSICRPVCNGKFENSFNICIYSNKIFNNAAIYNVNDACKHYYSPEEFYNHHPDNQKIISETCHRISSNYAIKIKPPRNVLKTKFKMKRKRTTFTTEQIIALEEVFHKRPYINREERIMMTKKLQINEKSIKVWFQNRRRLSDKRSKEYRSDSPSSDMSDSFSDRLAILESNINESTDIYGFVRLDNSTMAELANVIDEYLSQNINSHDEEIIQPVVSENKVIYEPISPVSLTDNQEEIDSRWDLQIKSSDHLTHMESLLFF